MNHEPTFHVNPYSIKESTIFTFKFCQTVHHDPNHNRNRNPSPLRVPYGSTVGRALCKGACASTKITQQ